MLSILLVIVLIVVVVVVLISRKKKHQKESEASTDVNPVYEGAADYDYDEMNYSTMATEDSLKVTVNKKEVLHSSFNVTSIFFSFDLKKNTGESRGSGQKQRLRGRGGGLGRCGCCRC